MSCLLLHVSRSTQHSCVNRSNARSSSVDRNRDRPDDNFRPRVSGICLFMQVLTCRNRVNRMFLIIQTKMLNKYAIFERFEVDTLSF